jgi:hypothetical protein
MPPKVTPELARLIDLPDAPRPTGWSLAASLTRYAQPQAALVGRVWSELRRVLWVLNAEIPLLEAEGPSLFADAVAAEEGGAEAASIQDDEQLLVAVLRAAVQIDALGDVLSEWAQHGGDDRPDDEVERRVEAIKALLDECGVVHEPAIMPPGARGGRGD